MKLLYFSRLYTSHDRRFLEAFRAAGMEVCHLCWERKALESRPLPEGVRSLDWPGGEPASTRRMGCLRRVGALRKMTHSLAYDVAVAGPIQSCAWTAACAGLSPLIAMAWGSDILVEADRTWPLRFMTRYALRHAAGAICDCLAAERALSRHSNGVLHSGNILSIPWGIDTRLFSPREPTGGIVAGLGWPKGSVLVSTRSWEPLYCVDTLVEAFAMVRQAYPDARLLLLGSGSQEEQIKALIEKLGIGVLVHMPGRIANPQMAEYLCASDLYISTALSDGTSISMLEAMGCGLPVIASKGYGNAEWVRPGVNGWLVEPRNPTSLASVICKALGDVSGRKNMASANRKLVCERADWPTNQAKLATFLEKVGRPG